MRYYLDKSKIKRQLFLNLSLSVFAVAMIVYAHLVGRLMGILFILFNINDSIRKIKSLKDEDVKLLVSDSTIELSMDERVIINRGSVVDFKVVYRGTGLTRLLAMNRELLVTHTTEVRGNLFNKKETIDISYLDITDKELSNIIRSYRIL